MITRWTISSISDEVLLPFVQSAAAVVTMGGEEAHFDPPTALASTDSNLRP